MASFGRSQGSFWQKIRRSVRGKHTVSAEIGGSCPIPLFPLDFPAPEDCGPSFFEDDGVGGVEEGAVFIPFDDVADSAASLLAQPPIVPAMPRV